MSHTSNKCNQFRTTGCIQIPYPNALAIQSVQIGWRYINQSTRSNSNSDFQVRRWTVIAGPPPPPSSTAKSTAIGRRTNPMSQSIVSLRHSGIRSSLVGDARSRWMTEENDPRTNRNKKLNMAAALTTDLSIVSTSTDCYSTFIFTK